MRIVPEDYGSSSAVAARKSPRRWLALPVILTGTFVVTLDFFIVNVAIPSIARDLGATTAAIQLVVAGYGLSFAAGLITAGRLGDLYGLRKVFALGLALFTVASAACGLAPTPAMLILARVLQGAAAALIVPQVLAILRIAYPGTDRAPAFAIYGMTMGLASLGGQLIGGLLIHADLAGLGWRGCFLVNLPVGAAALVLTPRLVPAFRPNGRARLDLKGAVLVMLGLAAVIFPLIQGRELGWPAWTFGCLAVAAVLLAGFALYQRRLGARGGTPLLDLTLFAEKPFAVGIVTILVLYAGVASFFLVLALYLQQGLGLDALASGAVFTTMAAGFVATSLSAVALTRRIGRQSLAVGALAMAAGLILLTVAAGHPARVALLIPGLVIDGAGMGLVMAPLISIVLADISPRHAGAASGVLSTAQQAANALGVAIIGLIFYGPHGVRESYAHAFTVSLIYLIALAVVVAGLVQLLPGRREAG